MGIFVFHRFTTKLRKQPRRYVYEVKIVGVSILWTTTERPHWYHLFCAFSLFLKNKKKSAPSHILLSTRLKPAGLRLGFLPGSAAKIGRTVISNLTAQLVILNKLPRDLVNTINSGCWILEESIGPARRYANIYRNTHDAKKATVLAEDNLSGNNAVENKRSNRLSRVNCSPSTIYTLPKVLQMLAGTKCITCLDHLDSQHIVLARNSIYNN